MERASTLQQWPTTEPTRSGRTHGIYSSPPPSVPGASTDSASASGGRSRLPGNSKKAVSLTNYIVCIHTEDVSFTSLPPVRLVLIKLQKPSESAHTQTGVYFKPKYGLRAPTDSPSTTEFIKGFDRIGLSFEFSIRARMTDIFAPFLEQRLLQHMETNGLELRNVEGIDVLPEAVLDFTTFNHAWQFLTVAYTGRKGGGGSILHPHTSTHSSQLDVSTVIRLAKKIPAPSPPKADRMLIIVGQYSRLRHTRFAASHPSF